MVPLHLISSQPGLMVTSCNDLKLTRHPQWLPVQWSIWWPLISLEANVRPVFHYCVHKLLWRKDRIYCHSRETSSIIAPFRNPECSINMESSDSRCKLKNFAKRDGKNEEKSVVILQNVSFIQPMKLFLLLRNRKKIF